MHRSGNGSDENSPVHFVWQSARTAGSGAVVHVHSTWHTPRASSCTVCVQPQSAATAIHANPRMRKIVERALARRQVFYSAAIAKTCQATPPLRSRTTTTS